MGGCDNMISPIIVALDFSSKREVLEFVDKIDPKTCKLKIGSELFTSTNNKLIDRLINKGFDIFLDLKYHDIPTTVAKACSAAESMGVWMVNVHALGGEKMMTAAKESLCGYSKIIAVTVLTSMNEENLKSLGFNETPEELVHRLSTLAYNSGMDGVVSSAREAKLIRHYYPDDFLIVTPGIRSTGDNINDQTRIMTPAQAISVGSDYLVIGRPITQARDPQKKIKEILDEISRGH